MRCGWLGNASVSAPLPGTKVGVAVYPGKAAGRSLESNA